uniref:Uncharacterized protein n=1 Tax=Arundo donax TaxID=35708 RepID=A0A0A9AJK2_ARUDO
MPVSLSPLHKSIKEFKGAVLKLCLNWRLDRHGRFGPLGETIP